MRSLSKGKSSIPKKVPVEALLELYTSNTSYVDIYFEKKMSSRGNDELHGPPMHEDSSSSDRLVVNKPLVLQPVRHVVVSGDEAKRRILQVLRGTPAVTPCSRCGGSLPPNNVTL